MDRNRREIVHVVRKTVHDRSILVHSFSIEDRIRRVDVRNRRSRREFEPKTLGNESSRKKKEAEPS